MRIHLPTFTIRIVRTSVIHVHPILGITVGREWWTMMVGWKDTKGAYLPYYRGWRVLFCFYEYKHVVQKIKTVARWHTKAYEYWIGRVGNDQSDEIDERDGGWSVRCKLKTSHTARSSDIVPRELHTRRCSWLWMETGRLVMDESPVSNGVFLTILEKSSKIEFSIFLECFEIRG